MKNLRNIFALGLVFFAAIMIASGQDKTATMKLSFDVVDSVKTCKVTVTGDDGKPVPDISLKVCVQRLFTLLPIGKDKTTDENGEATVEFPNDLPGDASGMLHVVAKVEDDENYGSFQTKADVNWGLPKAKISMAERSLAGGRDKAPIYFIVVSLVIIIGVWGTLVYVLGQVLKIRKMSKHLHTTKN